MVLGAQVKSKKAALPNGSSNSVNVRFVSYSNVALERLMHEKGWSQSELSMYSGIKQQNISNFIRGSSSPREEDLRSLGRALDVYLIPDWKNEDWVRETPRYKSNEA